MAYTPTTKDLSAYSGKVGYRPSAQDLAAYTPSILSRLESGAKSVGSGAERVGQDTLAGLAEGGHGLLNLPHGIASLISPALAAHVPHQKDYDFSSMVGVKDPNILDKLIQGGVSYAPFAEFGGELGPGIEGLASKIAPKLASKGGSKATELASRLLGQAPAGAAYSVGEAQHPTLKTAAEGAAIAPASELAGIGAQKALPMAAAPIKTAMRYLGSKYDAITPHAATILQALLPEGYHPDIGGFLQSQDLERKFSSLLRSVPMSGVMGKMVAMRDSIDKHGANLYGLISGGAHPSTADTNLLANINQLKDINIAKNKENYRSLANNANAAGVKILPTNTKVVASKLVSQEKKKLLTTVDPKISSQVARLASVRLPGSVKPSAYQYVRNSYGKLPLIGTKGKTTIPPFNTFSEAEEAHRALGDTASELWKNQKYGSARLASPLRGAISQDMDDAVLKSKDKRLMSQWADAKEFYANKVAPFEDPGTARILMGEKDAHGLTTQLLQDKDSSNKIRSMLNKRQKNALAFAKLQNIAKPKGLGHLATPEGLWSAYKRMPAEEAQKLLTPKQHGLFAQLGEMLATSKEARLALNQPFTGGRNTGILPKMLVSGSAGYESYKHPHEAMLLGALGMLGARGAASAMTSPFLRKAYIESAQHGALEPAAKYIAKGFSPLSKMFTGEFSGNQKGN